MRKTIVFLLIITFLSISGTTELSADVDVVTSSAILNYSHPINYQLDPRVIRLGKYLDSHKSPLASHADSFVEYADKYNLDWRLVPAISGVESTFGKRIPFNSYNAYGWANGDYRFTSWEDSIGHVSKSLREKYYDKGIRNINQMARRYAPPSSTWGWKVKFFMEKIDPVPVEFNL